jgi:hypothetical protein
MLGWGEWVEVEEKLSMFLASCILLSFFFGDGKAQEAKKRI